MPKPVARKPRSFPRGPGWGWDEKRQKVTLRHSIGGRRYIEREDSVAECLDAQQGRLVGAQAAAAAPNGEKLLPELWADWASFYVSDDMPAKTREGYGYSLSLIAPHLTCACKDIDAAAVEVALKPVVQRYSVETIAKLRGHLNMVFKHGVKHHYMLANPMPAVETPKGAKKRRPAEWFLEAEYRSLRAHLLATPTTGNVALLVGLLCGLRPGEILGLRWDAIDWERNTITVRTAVERFAQGRREQIVERLKTESSFRTVAMPADLKAALEGERLAQARRQISEAVFTNVRLGNKAFTTNALEWAMKKACLAVGHKVLPPNSLRHTNASLLLARGKTINEVARHLGHKNTLMVMMTYGHVMVDFIDTHEELAEPLAL